MQQALQREGSRKRCRFDRCLRFLDVGHPGVRGGGGAYLVFRRVPPTALCAAHCSRLRHLLFLSAVSAAAIDGAHRSLAQDVTSTSPLAADSSSEWRRLLALAKLGNGAPFRIKLLTLTQLKLLVIFPAFDGATAVGADFGLTHRHRAFRHAS